jgi:Arc/MetJ-type ribon-helix-helix transcriptional regulator
MKLSISLSPDDNGFLESLIRSGKAANKSHAVRLCIIAKRKEVPA